MPPRPFPHMLSVGNDICHHRRFFKYFEGKECEEKMFRMLDKVLLPSEQRMFWRKFQSLEQLWGLSNNRRDAAAEYIGGRYVFEIFFHLFLSIAEVPIVDGKKWMRGGGQLC